MSGWVEPIERRAALILDQMAAARALALRHGGDPDALTAGYRALLRALDEELPLARILDAARPEAGHHCQLLLPGPATPRSEPPP